MSDPQRREFLVTAAGIAALATLSGSQAALAGDPSFMNNVPDPDLSGKELPTFKFALEKSEGKVIGNSFGKEATVTQLPISKGIAGVSMKLEPGAMRELHWHATAAEWALVLEGRVRTTMIDPSGFAETNDFDPGDVWYFPRGHGHMLQCLGEKPCHFILIFDNGYFSEFGTFSITDWVGHTPKPLLAKTFGLPEAAFDSFPREEVYFARGKPPPAEPSVPLQGWKLPPETHNIACLHSRRTGPLRAAASGGWIPAASRSRKPSPASCSNSIPAACARCTGIRTPTSGNTSSTARSASLCSARTAATGSSNCSRATSATFRRATATRSRISATSPPAS